MLAAHGLIFCAAGVGLPASAALVSNDKKNPFTVERAF